PAEPVSVPAAPEPVPATVVVAASPADASDGQDAETAPVGEPVEEQPDAEPAPDPAPGEPLPAATMALTRTPAATVQPVAAPAAAPEAPPAVGDTALRVTGRPAGAVRMRDQLHPALVRVSGASPAHAGLLARDVHADAEAAGHIAGQRAGESRRRAAASPSRLARSSSLVAAGARRHARTFAKTMAVSARRARGAHDGSSSRALLVLVATSAALALA